MKTSEIITALRCISGPNSENDCEKCPYKTVEEYSAKTAEIAGEAEHTICDVDRICLEAAERLENFKEIKDIRPEAWK